MRKFWQSLVINLTRPYISREMPGWGRIYAAFVGDFRFDDQWKGHDRRWVRGKLHGYEMSLDLGYWSNRQTFFLKRFYDLPTQLVLQKLLREGDTFVDIGANEGMMSLLASRLVGSTGKVIAFEPNPAPRAVFESAIARNALSNVTVIPAGLGDTDEALPLSVPKINTGEGSFGGSRYLNEETEVVSCQVLRGDKSLAQENPALIKIDVEGFELRVLRGLEATLSRSRSPIVIEMVSDHLVRAGTSVSEVNSFLQRLGYRPQRLGLAARGKLKLLAEAPTDSAHADYLWTHPKSGVDLH
jgi:FkbM family methyltransferase